MARNDQLTVTALLVLEDLWGASLDTCSKPSSHLIDSHLATERSAKVRLGLRVRGVNDTTRRGSRTVTEPDRLFDLFFGQLPTPAVHSRSVTVNVSRPRRIRPRRHLILQQTLPALVGPLGGCLSE